MKCTQLCLNMVVVEPLYCMGVRYAMSRDPRSYLYGIGTSTSFGFITGTLFDPEISTRMWKRTLLFQQPDKNIFKLSWSWLYFRIVMFTCMNQSYCGKALFVHSLSREVLVLYDASIAGLNRNTHIKNKSPYVSL